MDEETPKPELEIPRAGNPNWIIGSSNRSGGRPVKPIGAAQTSTSVDSARWRAQETLRLLVEGYSCKEISKILNVHYQTVMRYAQEPAFREQLQGLRSSALSKIDAEIIQSLQTKRELIDELGFACLREVKKLIDDPNTHPAIKVKLAQDMLDRDQEVSRTKKVDITERRIELKSDDLIVALQSMRDIEERKALREAEQSVQEEEA